MTLRMVELFKRRVIWGLVVLGLLWSGNTTRGAEMFMFTNLDTAMQVSRQTGRPVLIHFYSPSCGPCRRMAEEVFTVSSVQDLAAQYYLTVLIDGWQHKELVDQFQVAYYPADYIVTSDGKIVARVSGFQESPIYMEFLSATAQRMQFQALSPDTARQQVAAALNPPPTVPEPIVPELVVPEPRPVVIPVSAPATHQIAEKTEPELPELPGLPELPEPEKALGQPKEEKLAPSPEVVAEVAPEESVKPRAMLDGYCPVTLVEQNCWKRGQMVYGVQHRGDLYLFASREAMEKFYARPDYYAIVSNGNDVVARMDTQENVPGTRRFGVRYDDLNFVFATAENREKFRESPEKYAEFARRESTSTAALTEIWRQ